MSMIYVELGVDLLLYSNDKDLYTKTLKKRNISNIIKQKSLLMWHDF